MIGNGCTDNRFDGNALPRFAVGKSLISTTEYEELDTACSGSYWDITPGVWVRGGGTV